MRVLATVTPRNPVFTVGMQASVSVMAVFTSDEKTFHGAFPCGGRTARRRYRPHGTEHTPSNIDPHLGFIAAVGACGGTSGLGGPAPGHGWGPGCQPARRHLLFRLQPAGKFHFSLVAALCTAAYLADPFDGCGFVFTWRHVCTPSLENGITCDHVTR